MKHLIILVVALLVVASPAAAARRVGPGPVHAMLTTGAYAVRFHLTPNLASRTGTVSVSLRTRGRPVAGARVRLTVRMLDMDMGAFSVGLPERSAGTYGRIFPVVGMSGRWGFRLEVTPRHGRTFSVALSDKMLG